MATKNAILPDLCPRGSNAPSNRRPCVPGERLETVVALRRLSVTGNKTNFEQDAGRCLDEDCPRSRNPCTLNRGGKIPTKQILRTPPHSCWLYPTRISTSQFPHLGCSVWEKYTPRPEHPKQHAPERKIHTLNLAYPEKSKAQVTPFEFKHPLFSNFPNVTYAEICPEDPRLNSCYEMCAHTIRKHPPHAINRSRNIR